MIFKTIINDYFQKNKSNVILYIIICSIDNIVRVLVTSKIYSSFLNKDADLSKTLKNVIFVWMLKFILSYSKSYLESIIIPSLICFVRNRLVEDYIKTNEVHFNDINISNDVRHIIDSTKLIEDIVVWSVESVIPVIALIICMNGYFLLKYPTVGTINIIGTIISLYIIKNNYKNVVNKTAEREELLMKLIDDIDEKLNNMMNIYLNNKSIDTLEEINKIADVDSKRHTKQYKYLEDFTTNIKIVNYIFSGLGLYALYKCTDRENFVNGLLIYTFFIQIQETIIEEIPRHIIKISTLNHIENYLQKKIYDRLNNITNKSYSNNLDNFKGNISINNLFFKYDIIETGSVLDDILEEKKEKPTETTNVINNLNLSIKSSERVSIYAKSGSGKSTLMKLLLAFYYPQNGSILFDGKDINTINPIDIRNRINYINQKTILFQDSIINNMRYGNNKSQEEIIEFLKKYNLLYIFKDCDKSENTCLNSIIQGSGLNMSLGMQKIIFLVRGILKDSDVYIFDEPLTSLDSKTRKNVIEMIDKETKGKTVIIITHDSEIDKIVDRQVNLLEIQEKKQNI